MALIKCPECKNMISEYASSCPNCGMPVSKISNNTVDEEKYDVILQFIPKSHMLVASEYLEKTFGYKSIHAINMLTHYPSCICGNISINQASKIKSDLESLECTILLDKHADDMIEKTNIKSKSANFVACPNCGSMQITTTSRGYSFWTGFLGSGKTVNRCAKCGHTWQPK